MLVVFLSLSRSLYSCLKNPINHLVQIISLKNIIHLYSPITTTVSLVENMYIVKSNSQKLCTNWSPWARCRWIRQACQRIMSWLRIDAVRSISVFNLKWLHTHSFFLVHETYQLLRMIQKPKCLPLSWSKYLDSESVYVIKILKISDDHFTMHHLINIFSAEDTCFIGNLTMVIKCQDCVLINNGQEQKYEY
jgi:hypothetical protein